MVEVEADDLAKQYPPVFTSECELTILVGMGACGALIGKGGCKIKETRETSGANVKISSDPLPYSDEKTVLITGSKEAVSMAGASMITQLAHNPKGHTPRQPFDPEQVESFNDGWGGGYGEQGPPGPGGAPPSHGKVPGFDQAWASGNASFAPPAGRGVPPNWSALVVPSAGMGFGPARGPPPGFGRGRGTFYATSPAMPYGAASRAPPPSAGGWALPPRGSPGF